VAHEIDVLLAKLKSIGRLNSEHQDAIRRLPVQRQFLERGQDAVMEGLLMHHCCIVLSGMLFRHKTMRDGSRQILSFHPAGDIPDLQSLHLQKVDYTLSATTQTTIGMVPHAAIHDLLRTYPELTGLFWRDTLIDASKFLTWMMLVGQASAEVRMAHLFCEMFFRTRVVIGADGGAFRFPVTQAELADALGISVVHANRTLQQLRSESLLAFNNGLAEILNWDGLSSLAQFDATYLHISDDPNDAT
jgi:CRP-like cAMP-binding protein